MVRTETPICEFNLPAIDFKLKGVDEQYYDLNSLRGSNGLLIMFICNHCPYVKSIISRIIRDTEELKQFGINSVGIMSNDPNEYEEDSFDLDIDGDEYAGGSYNINSDGTVVNMAVWNSSNESPVYGDKDDDVKTIIKKIKKLNF